VHVQTIAQTSIFPQHPGKFASANTNEARGVILRTQKKASMPTVGMPVASEITALYAAVP
jgi:hypothetical protein